MTTVQKGTWFGLLTVLLTVNSVCYGAPILTFVQTDLGGGVHQYDFTAVNGLDPLTQAGFDLFDIVFDFPAAPSVLSLPVGWDFGQNGNAIEAFSTLVGPIPFGSDIPPGASLGGFSFMFNIQLGSIPFTFSFVDPGNPAQPFTFSGVATSAVPEPSSLGLLLIGSVVLFAYTVISSRGRIATAQFRFVSGTNSEMAAVTESATVPEPFLGRVKPPFPRQSAPQWSWQGPLQWQSRPATFRPRAAPLPGRDH